MATPSVGQCDPDRLKQSLAMTPRLDMVVGLLLRASIRCLTIWHISLLYLGIISLLLVEILISLSYRSRLLSL